MSRLTVFLLYIYAWLSLDFVNAMYEDQVGEFDWKMEHLGHPIAVSFGGGNQFSVRGTSRAMYVATDDRSRAIARVDIKSGQIKWRRVFRKHDAIDAMQLTNQGLLVASSLGTVLRLWDITDGHLHWETKMFANKNPLSHTRESVFLYPIGDSNVLSISIQGVVLINLVSGSKIVTKELPASKSISNVLLSSDETKAYVLLNIGNPDTTKPHWQVVEVSLTGNSIVITEDDMLKSLPSSVVISNSPAGVVLTAFDPESTSNTIKIYALEQKNAANTHSIQTPSGAAVIGLDTNIKNGVALLLSDGTRLYGSVEVESINILGTIPSSGIIVDSQHDSSSIFHVNSFTENEGGSKNVQIALYSSDSSTTDIKVWSASFSNGGPEADEVVHAYIACSSQNKPNDNDSIGKCRALLLLTDNTWVSGLITADHEHNPMLEISWIREESLANIKQVQWIMPSELDLEKQSFTHIPTFWEEVALEKDRLTQLSNLMIKKIFGFRNEQGHISNQQISRVDGLSSKTKTLNPNAHLFGFSKYLIILTHSGNVFALQAETGVIIWRVYAGPGFQLIVTREHPALGAGAEIVLVSTLNNSIIFLDGNNGLTRHINTKDSGGVQNSANKWVILLPKRSHHSDDEMVGGSSSSRIFAVIEQDTLQVSFYPQPIDEDEKNLIKNMLVNFYFYRIHNTESRIAGYMIKEVSSNIFVAHQIWQVVLPSEQILAAKSGHDRENVKIDSSVTVTGDGSLLIKYLNPHLFGIATLTSKVNRRPEMQQSSAVVDTKRSLEISLVDAVTGNIVHRVKHAYAAEPVQMVQSENWVVYSYWNTREMRMEVVSLALFDGAVGSHGLNLFKSPAWSTQQSAYEKKAPFVLTKSYMSPKRISSLAFTQTSHGITPQVLLIGFENGQIFKLPRAFIDPRSPEQVPSPDEQSEGLIMYSPLLPILSKPFAMLTTNQSIAQLAALSVTSVELESQSLVFAYGLDLFYARLAPAKSFDLLPSDFNYEMLIVLCIAFISATLVSRYLAEQKALKEAWK